jgi:hypothetical protein
MRARSTSLFCGECAHVTELAERMGTTQSVISRLGEGGGRATASTPRPVLPRHSTGTSSCRSPRPSPQVPR